MRRAGYGKGIGTVMGCGGALVIVPVVAAFKFISYIAWPLIFIFGAFAAFIGGCFLCMALCKIIIFWSERYQKRHPDAFKAMQDAEITARLKKFLLEQEGADRV